MKLKKLLSGISALAVAASAFAGLAVTTNAADRTYTVLYSQNYEADGQISDWTTGTSGRYTPVIQTDGTNHWQGVDMTTRNNNGATLTSPNYSTYVASQDAYALEFDAAIGYTNGNQKPSFTVNTGDGFLFKLTTSDGVSWNINDSTDDTFSFASSGYTAGTASNSTWYHYTVIYKDGDTHLRIDNMNGETVYGPKIIVLGTKTGKLTTMQFDSARYSSNFEIDNVVIRTLDDQEQYGEKGVETLSSIVFTSQLNTTVTQPAENAPVHLPVAVKATGIYGSDLTDADGVDIKWTVTGLGEEDGYISLTKEPGTEAGTVGISPDGSASAYFNVRNGVSNWYGSVTATVTYLGKKLSISTPFAVIGASGSGNNLAPAAGYPTDMGSYADDLVGYKATSNAIDSKDIVLNGWSFYGNNSAKTLTLNKDEDGTKYLRFESNGGSGSAVGIYQLANQSSQYIVDMKVRFTGSAMTIGHYYNTPNNTGNNPNWSISYSGGAITAGTQYIKGMNATDWYRVIVSADESAGTYWVKVYDNDGALVGETSDEQLLVGASSSQKYFCFQGTYPVDLASLRIYYPTAASLTINTDAETLQVPENDTPATANLSAIMKDTDGYNMSGAVTWSLGDEYAGVSIDDNGVLSVTRDAGAGVITVIASYGSMRTEREISLSTTGNTMVFTKATSSITIPFEGEDSMEGVFAAEARDKDGAYINASVSYQMVDAAGEAVTGLRGVSFDAVSGKITVAPGAAAKTVYIKAIAVVGEETLTTRTKVSIHGLSFAFGSAAPEDDSFTQVTAADAYTDKLGYGFANTSVVSNEEKDVKGSAAYTFKAKVPNGNYIVTVSTSAASMKSEVVENITATTGITKSGSTFNVAVCDGVLDLTFPADSTVKSLLIAQAPAKQKLAKPMLYAIGDSTTKNDAGGNISWGNVVTQDMIPDVFSGFSNHGMAGRDSVTYYNQGRVEEVLLAINPGDYVTVNMGINSKETGEWASFPTLVGTYYVDGIIQRGGIPIITMATPGGPPKFYSNGKFTGGRGDDAHNSDLRNIAKARDLKTIELGQYFEDIFNSYTDADVAAYNTAQDTSFTSVYDMVASWYGDHNHYKQYLAKQIAEYMLDQAAAAVPAEYTVTFVADEKTVATRTVTAGGTVSDIPTVPSKTGYTGAWDNFAAETVINADKTVKAVYTANSLQSEVNTDMADSSIDISIEKEFSNQSATVPANTTVTISDSGAIKGGVLTSESGTFTVKKDDSTITNVSTVQFDSKGKMAPGDGAIISTPNKEEPSQTDNGYFITKSADAHKIKITIDEVPKAEFDIGETINGPALLGIFVKGIPQGKTVAVTAE